MLFKKYIALLFLYVFIGSVFSQELENNYKALKFKNLSLKEGLSQSSVLCILQDKQGFLWFGTRDGLNKYDGHNFKKYRHNSQNPNSISNSYISSLLEDEAGNLWVGTLNGLNKYNPRKNQFEKFKLANNNHGISNHVILSIASAGKGYLWLGTNYGLEKFNTKTGQTTRFIAQKGSINSISGNQIRSLYVAKNNNLWICNTKGIDVYNPKTNSFNHLTYPETALKKEKVNFSPVLYNDREQNLWLGYNNGLFLYNRSKNIFEPYQIPSSSVSKISTEVRSIHQDTLGNLWVGTYKGLFIINNNKTAISHYVHDENEPNSLSQNSIYKIFEDNKGDIWLGTYAGGVNYYDRSFDLFKHFSAGNNNYKLNYKVVSAIIEDSNNNLWVGTEGGGINIYNKKAKFFTYYTHDENNPNSLSTNNVKTMIRTRKGHFWIGTHDGGLNFLNPKNQPFKFKKFKSIAKDTTTLSNNRIISLFEDYQDNIWIGTSGGGINVLDVSTQLITRIQDPLNSVGNLVYSISKTSNKNILLVGGENGLAKINVKTKKITAVNYKEKQDAFSANAILCAYEDAKQNLWIATEGDGLYYYNIKTKKSIKYGMPDGLPNEVIHSVFPVGKNTLWVSTNHGLSQLNLASQQFKNFDVSDGLINIEFNYGAYLKLSSGELMFGGTNGIDFFNPNNIAENTFIPPVTITSFKVNNKPYLNITNSTKRITLKHKQNVFNFDFVALSYSQPKKNKYAYKLEGFDLDWNYIGNKKSATYTNLDEGDYTFKVKASNNDGVWNEKGAAIPITILPAPWYTWWAYLVYIAVFAVVVFLIRKYSLIRIQERNELKQERLEKERIAEVNKLKLELFTNISHDFRTPLTLILGPLERLLKVEEIDGFIKKQHEIMYRNASTLMELINQLLDFRKNESGKLFLLASKGNIVPFINHIKLAFSGLATSKNIDFSLISTNEDIEVWFDQTKLKKIIFNLLSNAFKFTPQGGKISIEISIYNKQKSNTFNQYAKIKVKDNGKGISKSNKKFIFDRFYQLGERSGTGIGLALTKNLVELHQGIIKVKSNENKGTSFTVLLPLGNKHLSNEQMVENTKDVLNNDVFNLEKAVYVDKEIIQLEEQSQSQTQKTTVDATLASILIVEDNAEVRAFVKTIFKNKYNVFEAEEGKAAIDIAKNKNIDLIISDVMMPIMDGMEMCNEIKTNIKTSHIPVVLLTAKTSQESQKTGYQIGADAYITKPFDANILEVRVTNLLESRKNLINKFKKDVILQPKELTITSADELFLKKAIDIVEKNLSNPEFTIPDFIEEMGTSRSVLYRKLKALTDQSISEFIKTIKLKRAAQLISKSDMNISEIAYDLGFNDLKHFRKSFQKMFNALPSQYRDNNSI